MFNKKLLINLLEDIADLMEFKGENIFKVNAFRNGANVIRRSEADVETLIKEKKIDSIKGIGKGLQSVIYEFYEKDESSVYNELKGEVPDGLLEILKIRGLGAKKVNILYKELGISSIGELEYACKENRLSLLKGFDSASQSKILSQIEQIKSNSKFLLLNKAEAISKNISEKLSKLKSVNKYEITGEMRRIREVVSEISFLILINKEKFLKEISKEFIIKEAVEDNLIIIDFDINIPVKFYSIENEKEFYLQLFQTTSPIEFLEKVEINNKISYKSEDEIFEKNKLPYIIPEMREELILDKFNSQKFKNSDLQFEHFKGFFHFHTTQSDGSNSLLEMVTEANKKGYEYFAVCDHSKSAFYANGLNEKRLLEQKKEIEVVKTKTKLPIFHGIESDILVDGSLDYPDDILSSFDFIVASVHSRFNLSEDEMTKRIINAVENKFTDVLGHPTGRLLLSRDSYQINIKKIIDACYANNVAIEINANPHRLDLDWRHLFYARDKGCIFSINPDAHSTEEIMNTRFGIMVARKSGMQPNEVINCYNKENFIKFINRKTQRNNYD